MTTRRISLGKLQQLIRALEYSVVSTTHEFPWAANATVLLPMAAWAEETGTYTNYAGRVQITNRAVAPAGESLAVAHDDVAVAGILRHAGLAGSRSNLRLDGARNAGVLRHELRVDRVKLGLETVKETVQ